MLIRILDIENFLKGDSNSASDISEVALAELEMLALESYYDDRDIGLDGAMKGVTDR